MAVINQPKKLAVEHALRFMIMQQAAARPPKSHRCHPASSSLSSPRAVERVKEREREREMESGREMKRGTGRWRERRGDVVQE